MGSERHLAHTAASKPGPPSYQSGVELLGDLDQERPTIAAVLAAELTARATDDDEQVRRCLGLHNYFVCFIECMNE